MILVPSWTSLITRPRPLLNYFNIQILVWTGMVRESRTGMVKTVLDSVLCASFTWRFSTWIQLVQPFWLVARQDYVLDLHHSPVWLLVFLFKIYKNWWQRLATKNGFDVWCRQRIDCQTSRRYHELRDTKFEVLSPKSENCHHDVIVAVFYISGFINRMTLFKSIEIRSFFLVSHRNDTRSTSRFQHLDRCHECLFL